MERSHRVDDPEFYQLLDKDGITDDIHLFNEKLRVIAAGNMMGGTGIRRITVSHESGKWATTERWTSTGLKPYFNDFVVHEGYA